ncbi:MAG: hypothetical protein D6701_15345, partial [Gemmatimonadetes bacterium]
MAVPGGGSPAATSAGPEGTAAAASASSEAVPTGARGAPGWVRGCLGAVGRDLPLFALLTAVLGAYLVARMTVLGSLTGEIPAPELRGLSTGERILTGLSLWPDYVRLMLLPLD